MFNFYLTVAITAGIIISPMASSAAPVAKPSAAPAPAGGGLCKQLEGAVDAGQKEMSFQKASELTENSAPRASVNEAKIEAAFLGVQANLTLMDQHHCQPYSHPITDSAYLSNALSCQTDFNKSFVAAAGTTPPSCDRKQWARD